MVRLESKDIISSLMERLQEIAGELRMRSNHDDPMYDDLDEIATELQQIADRILEEME